MYQNQKYPRKCAKKGIASFCSQTCQYKKMVGDTMVEKSSYLKAKSSIAPDFLMDAIFRYALVNTNCFYSEVLSTLRLQICCLFF